VSTQYEVAAGFLALALSVPVADASARTPQAHLPLLLMSAAPDYLDIVSTGDTASILDPFGNSFATQGYAVYGTVSGVRAHRAGDVTGLALGCGINCNTSTWLTALFRHSSPLPLHCS